MRHLVSGRKLNRSASHRRAMLSNLAVSILDKERITTTLIKAKEVRGVVERLITYGKKGDLHGIRLASRRVNDKTVLKKLFEDIAPSYKEREGGYTRIIKLDNRKGDNAPMSIIELVGRNGAEAVRKRKKKAKAKSVQSETATQTSGVEKTAGSETGGVAQE
jgi:large subunit ribosomal protein L17